MKRPHDPSDSQHQAHFETFEERLALSADPVADFRLLPTDVSDLPDPPNWIELTAIASTSSTGNGWTEVNTARSQYGLTGSKQTVAIIDSGIAYDHLALGGGLGRAYRVVGGWDFAENDANPYDDGPAGFHGTHVAGIVGANDKKYSGVASDVDLVALRVFDDQGNGYFHWVEQALRWVYDHRFAFDNPITTVNLSLGSEWNSATLPNWATLEDEFKMLEDAGIFISVAAGNSFRNYNQPGLSYPAASQYVVPVASVGQNGLLSAFSQRHSRVLAAPGEKVTSTLPDHFYGGDGYKNDWGASSGTSMAAPYVAGASVLMREAYTAMGYANVNQDLIYDTFYASADIIYDSITGASYRKLNLGRALESVIGADEFGSTTVTAHSLGSLTNGLTVAGKINSLTDQDHFRFTAGQSGAVTFVIQPSGGMAAAWHTTVAGARVEGNTLTFNVVAGQTYSFGVGTNSGIGKYQVQSQFVAAQPTPPATPAPPTTPSPPTSPTPPSSSPPVSNLPANGNLGTVHYAAYENLQVTGDRWLQMKAGRSGLLTVEALHNHAGGNIRLEVYNAQKLLLRSVDATTGIERLDLNAGAGSTYFVRLVGTNADVDLRITNMVTMNATSATIQGTSGNDSFTFSAEGGARQIVVNGTTYSLGNVSRVTFNGGGGVDTATLVGGPGTDTSTLYVGRGELKSSSYQVVAQAEYVTAQGGAGDTAFVHSPSASTPVYQNGGQTWVSTNGYRSTAIGFGAVTKVLKNSVFSTKGATLAQGLSDAAPSASQQLSFDEAISSWTFEVHASQRLFETTPASRDFDRPSDEMSPTLVNTELRVHSASLVFESVVIDCVSSDRDDSTGVMRAGDDVEELRLLETVFDWIGRAV